MMAGRGGVDEDRGLWEMPGGVRSVADHLRGEYFEDILRLLSDALSRFIS